MWYHFEKFVQGYLSSETFQEIEDTLTEEEIKTIAEEWAENVNDSGSSWAGWNTQWRKIECPPDDWIMEEIANHVQAMNYHRDKSKELSQITNPPRTKYGVTYFNDILKKTIQVEEIFDNKYDARIFVNTLKKEHLQDKLKNGGPLRYMHKAILLRSIKYIDEKKEIKIK
jgi:hypothetical protein